MPDDLPKEPAIEPTPEPIAEPVPDIPPSEQMPVEPSVESIPEVAAEAPAEAEQNFIPEQPLTESAPPETAQSENEPFSEVQIPAEPSQPSIDIEPTPAVQQAPPPLAPTPIPPFTNFTTRAREMLIKARSAIQSRKRKKLDRILVLLDEKKNIGNGDVEKLLHVSDATATRYLNQLEREGKIIQVGKTGQSVRYVKM